MAAAPKAKLAPDFDLATDGGGRIKLSELKGKKVVVYFYPKDDTSGCTLEAIDFSKSAKAFAKAGTVVIGISPDTEKSHDKFKAKHSLGITLAADPEKQAIDAFGVWVEKSMYGRKYMGVERSTFLIGPDRRIVQEWRKVKVPGHVDEVLAAASAL
jgi:thioredoxin-dependent peroxiredoxin